MDSDSSKTKTSLPGRETTETTHGLAMYDQYLNTDLIDRPYSFLPYHEFSLSLYMFALLQFNDIAISSVALACRELWEVILIDIHI